MAAATAPGRRKWWLFGLSALLLLAGALGSAYLWFRLPPPPDPPEIPLEGMEREVAEVVQLQRQSVAEEPRSGEAWGRLGRALLANDRHPGIALVCFRQAERLEPKEPRWPYFSAGLLLNEGKQDEALALLRRAVALCEQAGESNSAPRLLLAETLVALGQLETAEKHFRQVLAQDPNDLRAHFNLGVLALERGAWQECRTHLERCVAAPQARKKAAALLATVCVRLGDRRGADRYSDLAARLPKDFAWTDPFHYENLPFVKRKRDRYRLAEQLEAEGKYPQAVDILKGLAEAYPDDYLPQLMLGKVLPQMGQFQLGEKYLHKARELAPDKLQVPYLLGLVYFKQGEALQRARPGEAKALFEKSVRYARQALDLKPDYGFAHMCLGRSFLALGRRAEALAAARQAVHCNPEYADNHLFLGTVLLEENNLREARYYLEQARLLAPPTDRRPEGALEELRAREAKQGAEQGKPAAGGGPG
jgi:tetratricopeptide (TPR) repeat protein